MKKITISSYKMGEKMAKIPNWNFIIYQQDKYLKLNKQNEHKIFDVFYFCFQN